MIKKKYIRMYIQCNLLSGVLGTVFVSNTTKDKTIKLVQCWCSVKHTSLEDVVRNHKIINWSDIELSSQTCSTDDIIGVQLLTWHYTKSLARSLTIVSLLSSDGLVYYLIFKLWLRTSVLLHTYDTVCVTKTKCILN